NSQFFPRDNLNNDWDNNNYTIVYNMYSRFQSSYYNRSDSSLLSPNDLKEHFPLVVIDCSKQNESVKASSVDIRLELDFKENVPADTAAYCLILHDTIVTYTPLTGTVKRVL
ncbi:hypothetical protein, partial [Klebsiella pneumoniae]|uniref:hypothetical protein n=1 Tax=Klebsiella pneumoniae TaxID=573 RepID=UPI001C8F4F61